jgi:hypothetical protein
MAPINGLSLPAYDTATLTQTTATNAIFSTVKSDGTATFGITKNGNPILRRYTTKPTTGLSKNELYLIYHGSMPKLALCYTAATSAVKLIRFKTKTLGRITA